MLEESIESLTSKQLSDVFDHKDIKPKETISIEAIADNYFTPPKKRITSIINFDRNAINKIRRSLNKKDMDVIKRWVKHSDNWDKIKPEIPELKAVAKKIHAAQPIRLPKYLYRGVARSNSYDWGVIKNGWLKNEIDPDKENKPFKVIFERPMSFTTDLDIAKHFGSHGLFKYSVCVITLETKDLKPSDYLILSKEVLYLLNEFYKSGCKATSNKDRKEYQKKMEQNDAYYDDDEVVVFPTKQALTLIARKPNEMKQNVFK